MFASLPRMQATRLLTLFSVGGLLVLFSLLYSSLLSPSIYDLSDLSSPESYSYSGYLPSSLSAAKSAASKFFHSAASHASSASRITLFTWGGGNKAYELEPLEEYIDLAASGYPVGAKLEGGIPEEWTITEEERAKFSALEAQKGKGEMNWDFPAPQVDLPEQVVQVWEPPTIEFALVIMGESAAVEAVTMLKGILMHISTPVHLHIVCDEDAMYYMDERLSLITRPANNIWVSYNLLSPGQIWARAARAGIGSTYHAGAGGLAKIFLHEILTETKRAVFIDIDTLFTVDPVLLWKEFDRFKPGQVFALPTLGPQSDEMTTCSCTLLLDLEAMRDQHQWVASDLRPQASRTDVAYSSLMSVGLDPRNPPFGDQGVYYAIWKAHPELGGHLSLSWDVSHCRNHWGFSLDDGDDEMTEEEQERRRDERMKNVEARMRHAPEKWAIFPGILHFNCIDNAANSFTYSDIVDTPAWGPIVQTATQYKWTWLNRGDGSAKMERVMYEDVRFADERWPEVEHVGGWEPAKVEVGGGKVGLGMPVFEGETGGEWAFVEAEQGQVEGSLVEVIDEQGTQPEYLPETEQVGDWVLGQDGEWHMLEVVDDVQPAESEWAQGDIQYDEPVAYNEPPPAYVGLPDYVPTAPSQGDWMDEPPQPEPAPVAAAQPPANQQEPGTWVLGPYGEWIWVPEPVSPAEEPALIEYPEEAADSWTPAAVVGAPAIRPALAPAPAMPIPTEALAPPAAPLSAASADELDRETLKEMLAAALKGLAPPSQDDPPRPRPVVEAPTLPPLRMARPDIPTSAPPEPAYDPAFAPSFDEYAPAVDEALPAVPISEIEEQSEPTGEWVQDASGEWTWVAA